MDLDLTSIDVSCEDGSGDAWCFFIGCPPLDSAGTASAVEGSAAVYFDTLHCGYAVLVSQ